MKLLVTGASGLLGKHVSTLLRAGGHDVTTASRQRKLESATFLADLSSPADIETLPKDFDCVIHLAALLPAPGRQVEEEAWFLNNAQATLNLLEFCARNRIGRFIYGSTWSVYADASAGAAIKEDAAVGPTDSYSLSKLAGEILTHPYRFNYDLEVKILRFSYIYGLGMREDTVVRKFIDLAIHNSDIPLFNGGEDHTDLVYVSDAAEAVEAALSHGHGIYNIGSGVPATIRQLAEAIIAIAGSASKCEFKDVNRVARKQYLSVEKAFRDLGWSPRHTLRAGLKEFIEEIKCQA